MVECRGRRLGPLLKEEKVCIDRGKEKIVGCKPFILQAGALGEPSRAKIGNLCKGIEDIPAIVMEGLFMQIGDGGRRIIVELLQQIIPVQNVLCLITGNPGAQRIGIGTLISIPRGYHLDPDRGGAPTEEKET
jgi:hypothetical protein